MITLIQQYSQNFFQEEMDAFYKRRYKVFKEKLGWNIETQGNKDIDQYDLQEAMYLIYKDEKEGVCGGIRLLPTTGSYMLRDTFSHLFDKSFQFPCHPLIWESSRFFFDKPMGKNDKMGTSRQGTIELLIAMMEFIISFSPYGLITVTDTRVEALCLRVGLTCRRISEPQKIDDMKVVCLYIEADMEKLRNIKAKHSIDRSLVWVPLPIKIPFLL